VTIPLISNLVWALSYGHVPATQPNNLAFRFPPAIVGAVPRFSAYLFAGPDEDGLHLLSQGILLEPAPESACVGVVKTGFGRVQRRAVPATWLWKHRSDNELGRARPGERVILYFVGGALRLHSLACVCFRPDTLTYYAHKAATCTAPLSDRLFRPLH
jgi:hypothetical protein